MNINIFNKHLIFNNYNKLFKKNFRYYGNYIYKFIAIYIFFKLIQNLLYIIILYCLILRNNFNTV